MRLEPLCTFEWSYDADGRVAGGYVVLRPFGGDDGAGYGEGRGTVAGDRLAGPASGRTTRGGAATAGCSPMRTA